MTFWVPPEEGSIIVTLGHDSYGHPRGVDLSNVPDPIGILWVLCFIVSPHNAELSNVHLAKASVLPETWFTEKLIEILEMNTVNSQLLKSWRLQSEKLIIGSHLPKIYWGGWGNSSNRIIHIIWIYPPPSTVGATSNISSLLLNCWWKKSCTSWGTGCFSHYLNQVFYIQVV